MKSKLNKPDPVYPHGLSEEDLSTVARIVAEKAMEMHKKGAMWVRGDEYLSCVDIGKIANKLIEHSGAKYDFDSVFKPKKKRHEKSNISKT